MLLAGWGQTETLIKEPNLWLCYQCNDCTTYCPRGARPGDVLAAVRVFAYKHFSFPSFMGKAVASPSALPLLLLVPTILLLGCMFLFAPQTADGSFQFLESNVVDFNLFLPHSSIDALFVFGGVMIFLFAGIGMGRFWKGLRQPGQDYTLGFVSALILTIKEIISHSKFRECEASHSRAIGHQLLIYGFVGAFVTTLMVFALHFIPEYLHLWFRIESLHPFIEMPVEFPNPVKILGGLSGMAIIIGCGLLIARYWGTEDESSSYSDNIFLYMMFFTSLTGMLSWFIRVADMAMAAYVMYFLHLVCVFYILWYMPYSKFAHMVFRTLALVHARMIGRIQ